MKKLVLLELIILLCGTIFAWTNFTIEYSNYLDKKACTTGCAIGLTNPFLTPCFGGAVFFSIALILIILIFKKTK